MSKIRIERPLSSLTPLMSWLVAAVAVLVFALPAVGQDRDQDRGRGRGKDRERRDRDREIQREKWSQKFDVKDYLGKLDVDKNGVLEKREMKGDRTRGFLKQLGINTANPVKIEGAVKKVKDAYAKKVEGKRKEFADQVGPKLNSFGVEPTTMGVDAFGDVEAKASTVASFDERLTGLKLTDFDEKTMKKARKILDGYDRDKSGFLEGDEISRIRWKDPEPAESDLNGDGRISLLEMAQRTQAESKSSGKRMREPVENEPENRESERRSLEKRGGGQSSYNRTSGTGPSNNSSSNRSSGEGSRSSKPVNDDAEAFSRYVDGVYKKYDTDGDHRLSPDELKKMRRPLKGDTDKDGFLSKVEATAHIKKESEKRSQSQKPKAATSNDLSQERRRVPVKGPSSISRGKGPSSGRAKQRGSLSDMDSNSDGQIQMAEFSTTWDEATLQSFRKTDADQDGIISADEWSARSK